MVKMYRFLYTGNSVEGLFTKGKLYVGRNAKSGDKIMVRCDGGIWVSVYDGRMTISRMWKDFMELETFTVANHKEAVSFKNISYGELLEQFNIALKALDVISDQDLDNGYYYTPAIGALEEMGRV